jgi:hypothetical protein
MSKHSDFYDEILGHSDTPDTSSEYDPYDPLGLSSGRTSCTMRPVASPLAEEMADVFIQDSKGNWVEDKESEEKREILMRRLQHMNYFSD